MFPLLLENSLNLTMDSLKGRWTSVSKPKLKVLINFDMIIKMLIRNPNWDMSV